MLLYISVPLFISLNFNFSDYLVSFFNFSFHSVTKLILKAILASIAIYSLLDKLKNIIQSSIVTLYNKKELPSKIQLKKNSPIHTESFNRKMSKKGNIVQYSQIKNSYVLSEEYRTEFTAFPNSFFNIIKARCETNNYNSFKKNSTQARLVLVREAAQFFSFKYLNSLIQSDIDDISMCIDNYIQHYGITIGLGVLKINNAMDMLIYALSENAFSRVLGGNLSNDTRIRECLLYLTQSSFMRSNTNFKLFQLINNYFESKNFEKNILYLGDAIKNELSKVSLREKSKKKSISFIDIMHENKKVYSDMDNISIAFCIESLVRSMIAIPPSRIINVLIDISDQLDRGLFLAQEQRQIIKKFGGKLSLPALSEMKYLNSFISESINLSSPASFLYRKTEGDLVMSNGLSIPKGSLVSFNLFAKYNSPKDAFKIKNFDPTKYFNTSVDGLGIDELNWGYGSNSCPFKDYALAQMKVVISILLRKYYMFNKADKIQQTQPRYTQIATVSPGSTVLYLQKYKINNFQI